MEGCVGAELSRNMYASGACMHGEWKRRRHKTTKTYRFLCETIHMQYIQNSVESVDTELAVPSFVDLNGYA